MPGKTPGPLDISARYGTFRGLVRFALGHVERATGKLSPFAAPDWSRVDRLVFVCMGNVCRSPYAERKAAAYGLNVSSFGLDTQAGRPAFETALERAAVRGVDLSGHGSQRASEFEILSGDLLVAMEPRQAYEMAARFSDPRWQLSLLGLWAKPIRPHIHDPYGLSGAYFDTCFDVIDTAVETMAGHMGRR